MNATGVTAGLTESNGKLLLGIWRDSLHVTCGLTACTPGSAPGPTLGNEYGKTLPFFIFPDIKDRECIVKIGWDRIEGLPLPGIVKSRCTARAIGQYRQSSTGKLSA